MVKFATITKLDIVFIALLNIVLTIGFEPITYQVSEAMGAIDVCFEVEENNVLDVTGQAILDTLSGSANECSPNAQCHSPLALL